MAIYIGFYEQNPTFAQMGWESARSGGGPDKAFLDKVQALPGALPAGTQILGSYASMAADRPSVMIVETEDPSGLNFISQYYNGYLQFSWTPVTVVGGSAAERANWRSSVEN